MPSKDLKNALSSRRSQPASQDDEELGLPFGEALRQQLEQKASNEPIREIAIARLVDNPYQHLARAKLDENDEGLQELANSIREVGFHGALLARPKSGQAGYFELAFGHRRRRAAELVGLNTLPVKVLDLADEQMLFIMAGENFARVDLEPLHEALVVGEIATTQNLSVREIAEKIGQKPKWVEYRLALYNAPQDVKDLILQKPNTLGHVQRLVTIKETEVRTALVEQILEKDMTQAELNDWLRQYRAPFIPTSTISTPTNTSTLAANPSPAAPTPTNPTPAATPSAVPNPASTASAGPALSPASAGSYPHPQQSQPQPLAPTSVPPPAPAGVGQFPTPAQQPSQSQPHTLPISGAGGSGAGPNKGVAKSAPATYGFATIPEYLAAEAETDPATTISPGDYYSHGDPGEDGAGEGFNSYDLDDFTGASTEIEDYLSQPASQWGLPIAEFAVALARLTNLSYVPSTLAEITTEEWELLNRVAQQLQIVLGRFS